MSTKSRDAYFDNAKALLIVCVVLGHTLSGLLGEARWLDSLYLFIYTFHMPAFIFVTGYYARVLRTKKDWWKLTKAVVIPYFILQFAYTAYYIYVLDFDVAFNLFEQSRWGLWFLVSLFCWRIMLPLFTRSKWMIVVALIMALIAGELSFISEPYSLSRTLFFFVFFIAGYHLSVEPIKARAKKMKFVGAAIFVTLFTSIYFLGETAWKEWLFGRLPYAQIEPFLVESGSVNRLLVYTICAVATFAFLAIVPRRNFNWTIIGQRTMAIYVFHLAIVQTFRETTVYDSLRETGQYAVFFLFVFLTVVICAHPFFTKLIQGDVKKK